jgi:hypothetical protein
MSAPPIGHNVGPPLDEREEYRQLCIAEIAKFAKERAAHRGQWERQNGRAEHDLVGIGRQDLGRAERRPWALLRSIIENLVEWCRTNPHADRGAAVLVIDSLFSQPRWVQYDRRSPPRQAPQL